MDSKAFFQSSTLISTKNEKKLEVFLFVSNIHVFTKNMGSVIFMGGGGFVYNSAQCVLYKSIWIIEYSPIVRRFGLPCPLYSYLLYGSSIQKIPGWTPVLSTHLRMRTDMVTANVQQWIVLEIEKVQVFSNMTFILRRYWYIKSSNFLLPHVIDI